MKLALYVQLFITQGQKGGPGVLAASKILKFKAASNPGPGPGVMLLLVQKYLF
jgi:hypothetical protein